MQVIFQHWFVNKGTVMQMNFAAFQEQNWQMR